MARRIALAGLLGAGLIFVGFAAAQKDGIEKHPDPAILASENVKELLLLMDRDKNGKITKEEWMKFISAEFDRLDVDKSGELDPKQLKQRRVRGSYLRSADSGK